MVKQEEMNSIDPLTSFESNVESCSFDVETIGLIEETNCESVSLIMYMQLITCLYPSFRLTSFKLVITMCVSTPTDGYEIFRSDLDLCLILLSNLAVGSNDAL